MPFLCCLVAVTYRKRTPRYDANEEKGAEQDGKEDALTRSREGKERMPATVATRAGTEPRTVSSWCGLVGASLSRLGRGAILASECEITGGVIYRPRLDRAQPSLELRDAPRQAIGPGQSEGNRRDTVS